MKMSDRYVMCIGNHIPWNIPPESVKTVPGSFCRVSMAVSGWQWIFHPVKTIRLPSFPLAVPGENPRIFLKTREK
jgi:hypothetical protein